MTSEEKNIYHSYKTTQAMVIFQRAVANILDRIWREVTPDDLRALIPLLDKWIELLEIDFKKEEMKDDNKS